MTCIERVKKAVEFTNPDRIPLRSADPDNLDADFIEIRYKDLPNHFYQDDGLNEWGFAFESLDHTMGQVKKHPLENWQHLSNYRFPDPTMIGRFNDIDDFREKHVDKYIAGQLLYCFSHLPTWLRGFENFLTDAYLNRDKLESLLDMVKDFNKHMIRGYAEKGLQAVHIFDDWGTQESLMIKPELWREIFAPRYRELVEMIHSLGMHAFLHSCGNIWEIIPDLINIGFDALHLNQPRIFGIERLGKHFGGKICFICPVDIQRTLIVGSIEEIEGEVKKLIHWLGSYSGGLIGIIRLGDPESYPPDNYEAMRKGFILWRKSSLIR